MGLTNFAFRIGMPVIEVVVGFSRAHHLIVPMLRWWPVHQIAWVEDHLRFLNYYWRMNLAELGRLMLEDCEKRLKDTNNDG